MVCAGVGRGKVSSSVLRNIPQFGVLIPTALEAQDTTTFVAEDQIFLRRLSNKHHKLRKATQRRVPWANFPETATEVCQTSPQSPGDCYFVLEPCY